MADKSSDKRMLIPTIDWTPSNAARIDHVPPVPRTFGQTTMFDEDDAAAQEDACAGRAVPGILRDWGSIYPDDHQDGTA